MYTKIYLGLILFFGLAFEGHAQQVIVLQSEHITSALSSHRDPNFNLSELRSLYTLRNNTPLWIVNGQLSRNAMQLKQIFESSHQHGLNPSDYLIPRIQSFWNAKQPVPALELELLLSQAVILYVSDLSNGRLRPDSVDNEIDFRKRTFTHYTQLNNILTNSQNLTADLERFSPPHPQYQKLKQELARLQALQKQGSWTRVETKRVLKSGFTGTDVAHLRKRLFEEEHLSTNNESTSFDLDLVNAVKSYQYQNNMPQDGIVGPKVLVALNSSIEKMINSVIANMEKWRWLPAQFGDRYIFVNTAHAFMTLFENKEEVMSMKVVIGRMLRRTPTLADRITEVRMNPYWNVPENLVNKDILSNARKNVQYFTNEQIKIFDRASNEIDPTTIDWTNLNAGSVPYRFRQEPGAHNSLGRVKFNMTNNRAIYMHDTNHKEHFPMSDRHWSSGCIRLEKPVELAQYLLRDKGDWSKEEILQYTTRPTQTQADFSVPLTTPMPVVVAFLTVTFDKEGRAIYANDVYGQDERIIRAFETDAQGYQD
ncbi:MAG: murein L,D-transpeptidase [Bdellovibrionales bacterium]